MTVSHPAIDGVADKKPGRVTVGKLESPAPARS